MERRLNVAFPIVRRVVAEELELTHAVNLLLITASGPADPRRLRRAREAFLECPSLGALEPSLALAVHTVLRLGALELEPELSPAAYEQLVALRRRLGRGLRASPISPGVGVLVPREGAWCPVHVVHSHPPVGAGAGVIAIDNGRVRADSVGDVLRQEAVTAVATAGTIAVLRSRLVGHAPRGGWRFGVRVASLAASTTPPLRRHLPRPRFAVVGRGREAVALDTLPGDVRFALLHHDAQRVDVSGWFEGEPGGPQTGPCYTRVQTAQGAVAAIAGLAAVAGVASSYVAARPSAALVGR